MVDEAKGSQGLWGHRVFLGAFVFPGHRGPLQLGKLSRVLANDHGPNLRAPVFDPRWRSLSHERLDPVFGRRHSDRITEYPLPSYSPDYNPIDTCEKTKQRATHNKYFKEFVELAGSVESLTILPCS